MKRKMVCGVMLFRALVLCMSTEAFGQNAYVTSLNEP